MNQLYDAARMVPDYYYISYVKPQDIIYRHSTERRRSEYNRITSCAGGRRNMPPPPVTLTFDLLILKVVSESRVTWATSVPMLYTADLADVVKAHNVNPVLR